jgi:hypothetical protein
MHIRLPEPSSVLLIGAGLALVGYRGRRLSRKITEQLLSA